MYFSSIDFRRLDYAESDVNVPVRPADPSTLSNLGTEVYLHTGYVYPRRDEIFSVFNLTLSRETVLSANYVVINLVEDATSYDSVKAEWKSTTHTIYGWIDSVTAVSDTAAVEEEEGVKTPVDSRVIEVRWHPDWWASCIPYTRLGYGLVSRRPRSDYDPPQPLNPITVYTELVREIIPTQSVMWAVMGINITQTSGSVTTTQHRFAFFPVRYDSSTGSTADSMYIMQGSGQTTDKHTCPSLRDLITGTYMTEMGIASDAVTSLYLSPISPVEPAGGDGSSDSPFYFTSTTTEHHVTKVLDDDKFPFVGKIDGGGHNWPNVNMFIGRISGGSGDRICENGPFYQLDWSRRYYGYRHCHITDWRGLSGTPTSLVSYEGDFNMEIRSSNGSVTYYTTNSWGSDPMRVISLQQALDVTGISSRLAGDTLSVYGDNVVAFFTGGHIHHSEHGLTGDPNLPAWFAWQVDTIHQDVTGTGFVEKSRWSSTYVVIRGSLSGVTLDLKTTAVTGQDVNVTVQGTRGYCYTLSGHYVDHTYDLGEELQTTDAATLMVSDWGGVPQLSLPWGFPVRYVSACVVLSTASCYIRIRFDGLNSSSEQVECRIACPTVAVVSNAWSNYLYSGQRDADVRSSQLACQAAMVNAVAGGIEGAATGAIIGGVNVGAQGADAIAGARASAIGAAGGLVSGLVGAVVQQWQSGELQSVKDTTTRRAVGSVTYDSSGGDWIWHGRGISLIIAYPDEYSAGRWLTDIVLNGARVSEAWADADELLDSEGPLKFDDVQVYMNSRSGAWMPVEAQRYIKQRLIRGVRLE